MHQIWDRYRKAKIGLRLIIEYKSVSKSHRSRNNGLFCGTGPSLIRTPKDHK